MKLKTARRAAGLTQQELARRASVPGAAVDESLINKLETGDRALAFAAYVRVVNIARALGVDASMLVPSVRRVRRGGARGRA